MQNGRAKRPKATRSKSSELSASKESIKTAEDLALAAFSSGLKLAAAFGSVAAKTTGMALASIATGADKFSELVKQEALRSQKFNSNPSSRTAKSRPTRRSLSKTTARRRQAARPSLAA